MMSAQAAAMRISELEAQIHAKDTALSTAKAHLQAVNTDIKHLEEQLHMSSSQYARQLEGKLGALEAEYEQLRGLREEQLERERLKLELEHGQQLRIAFEAKFKQAKVQLLGLQSASDPQCIQLQRDNEALRREIAALKANPPVERGKSLEKELQTLRSCYQRLSLEARQETTAYAQPNDLPETPRVLYQTPPALLSEAPSRSRSKPESQGSPVSTSKMSAVSTASYCPSFLRRSKGNWRVQAKKPPCSKYLRLDSQRETFEGVDPV
jgi:hypothetical protein